MIKIVQQENKILHEIAKPIPIDEIKSDKIQKIITDMKEALNSQDDGVAIAAPQIDVPLRIFIVSKRAFAIQDEETENEGEEIENLNNDLVFINPEVIKLSKKKKWLEEGCLSVRWLYGDVKRSINATVSAYDEKGKQFTRGAGGLLAQIFQHETDHLNGTLFIDKAKDIEEILPEKNEQ